MGVHRERSMEAIGFVELLAALAVKRRWSEEVKGRMMAETLVRVGNACYASSNRSYGLTTLRNHHIDFLRGGRAPVPGNRDVIAPPTFAVVLAQRRRHGPRQSPTVRRPLGNPSHA